jgi:hypothetical protein
VGAGQGSGYSVNIPWPKGDIHDSDYIAAFTRIILPLGEIARNARLSVLKFASCLLSAVFESLSGCGQVGIVCSAPNPLWSFGSTVDVLVL